MHERLIRADSELAGNLCNLGLQGVGDAQRRTTLGSGPFLAPGRPLRGSPEGALFCAVFTGFQMLGAAFFGSSRH